MSMGNAANRRHGGGAGGNGGGMIQVFNGQLNGGFQNGNQNRPHQPNNGAQNIGQPYRPNQFMNAANGMRNLTPAPATQQETPNSTSRHVDEIEQSTQDEANSQTSSCVPALLLPLCSGSENSRSTAASASAASAASPSSVQPSPNCNVFCIF